MNRTDPVLQRIAQLPTHAPSDATSARICALSAMKLRPHAVHPAFSWVVIGTVVLYLSWALQFVARWTHSG